jgi:gamma-glutamyltranspeptidase/glutathione hydrolase
MLVHLADGRDLAIDGSCRAPVGARPDEMQRLRNRFGSMFGYKSVATPGTLAALALALDRYGTKTLAEVLAPAIELAEYGSPWRPALRSFLGFYLYWLFDSPTITSLFLKDGIEPWPSDHVYCNPDLACFMRRLAVNGADDFYHGEIAGEIEADMIANGGWLRRGDLGLMKAEVSEPVRGRYRGLEVLSFPLPVSGAEVVEALGILDRFPPELLRSDSVDRLHLLIEACRLAHADSTPFRRPPRLPDELATDPDYVAARAALIRLDRALGRQEVSPGPLSTLAMEGTTQVSVADAAGNVVSLTQTLGNTFGAAVATEGFGFAYNNMVFGFEYQDARAWRYLRPFHASLTSMAPTILLKGGKPYLVLGSAGSERIPSIVVNVISAVVDKGLPPCEAVAAPRVLWGGFLESRVYLELVDPITEEQAAALAARGFALPDSRTYPATPAELTAFGGANAIFIDSTDGTMVGVGDPRRQGVATAPRDGPPDPGRRVVPPECWRSYYPESPSRIDDHAR